VIKQRRASCSALSGSSEKTLRPKQENREEQTEADSITHARANVSDRENLGKPKKKTAQ
jgi:hypothetical protein